MQVFKGSLRTFFRHPTYIMVYIVMLGILGLFMGMSAVSEPTGGEFEERPRAAVVDRDGSGLSHALVTFVGERCELVEIADGERALQDATAQDLAAYILIIPEGFEDGVFEGFGQDAANPVALDTVVSYESYSAAMMNNLVDSYLDAVGLIARAEPDASRVECIAAADAAMAHTADVSVEGAGGEAPMSQRFLVFLQFSSYTVLLSVGVCTAVVLSKFGREEIRRRNAASPLRPRSAGAQLAGACAVVMLLSWAFVSLLGTTALWQDVAGMPPARVAAALASLLAYALFGLSVGFLVGGLAKSELVMNAAVNITGLVLSFLGGTWIPLDLAGEPVATIARFFPSYYYNEAVTDALDGVLGAGFWVNVGIVALFAAALLAVGAALSRRMRSE